LPRRGRERGARAWFGLRVRVRARVKVRMRVRVRVRVKVGVRRARTGLAVGEHRGMQRLARRGAAAVPERLVRGRGMVMG